MSFTDQPAGSADTERSRSIPLAIAIALGFASLAAWVLPIVGLPMSITSAILARSAYRGASPGGVARRWSAVAGGLAILGFLASAGWFAMDVYLSIRGINPPLRPWETFRLLMPTQ